MSETKAVVAPSVDNQQSLETSQITTPPLAFSPDKHDVIKKLASGVFFLLLAISVSFVVPNVQIAWVVSVLLMTIYRSRAGASRPSEIVCWFLVKCRHFYYSGDGYRCRFR